ncbi:SIMPL domain-containing protein [Chitiniphilus purpureus]|uniref:SIMPL domain-containing protein n=1 Tax=Chitiniphilus purpureus TaxID=2981137 RepID=A0ABY6DKG2_9NEIS|nr:SIMPL domain-containing protein [Chitiniphilus sp. CD1]UXY13946.1 SIMPL domain-containing protein [Chitiniphilus sp. CD1]
MLRRNIALAVLATLTAAGTARAEPLNYNVVNLEASAQRAVSNDLAVATLFVEVNDNDPTRLANKVNRTLGAALKLVKQVPVVKNEGTGYATHPVYNPKTNRAEGWRGRGELRVSSRDFEAFSKLLGQLQQPLEGGQPLQLAGIHYAISDDARGQLENELIEESLKAFRQRADLISRSMAAKGWRTVNLNVNTQALMPPPMLKTMSVRYAAEADATQPPLEGGDSKVTVTVNGSIQVE